MKVAVVVTLLALAEPFALAVTGLANLAFCASDNTGSSFKEVTDTFQSNGACIVTCSDYAYGVLQGKKCWCTNVVPSQKSQKKISDCDTKCPGYPDDRCGSAAKGVFAYVEIIGNAPTSTAGASSSGTSSSSSSSSTSSDGTTTTPATTSTQTDSGGQVKTITVPGSVSTGDSDSSSANASADSSKLSGGSIAGIVIGVLGGLALIAALIFLILFYRKRARAASPVPSQDMADNRASAGSSFMGGFFPRGNGEGAAGTSPARSGTTFTDRRMKTNTVLYPNGARDSSVSLQDNEDYSRPVLRLTNPD
ncbi:Carbohydrate-binding WSC subgroup [Penicillium bovifimosum]|uniref:Carbohydrate-binding WSC subgroup n=1 Tax=Penicillium bovifimosum TaxID=126998 RepID=A0A9W9HFP6_9EURO|nr:Carbohydrate-binding WSC subgroup [Penicillium bovifimosum]KAJ5146331.1 Carbohydrate-binding WSC subgroup [Penicillium bovifimosum]